MLKTTKLQKHRYLITLVCNFFVCFLFLLTSSCSFDHGADTLSKKMRTKYEGETPILKIEGKEKNERFTEFYNQYVFSSLIGRCREMVEDVCYFSLGATELSVKPITQRLFSLTQNKYSGNYWYLSEGKYFCYYGNNDVPAATTRFGCNTFAYISESLACKLLDYYGLDSEDRNNSFLQLITNKEFAVLTLKASNSRIVTASINNIIVSGERDEPRSAELYEDFCLFYPNALCPDFYYSFEIDINNYGSTYSDRTVFKSVMENGYADGYNFSILTKNRFGKYVKNDELTSDFNSFKSKDSLSSLIGFLLAAFSLLGIAIAFLPLLVKPITYPYCELDVFELLLLIVSCCLFLEICVLMNLYYLYSLIPVLTLVAIAITLCVERGKYGKRIVAKYGRAYPKYHI